MTKQDWTKWKGIITGGLGALTARLGTLAYPMAVLAALNLVDYATGYLAAPCRGQRRQSDVGFRGIVKKVCMWLLVGLGAVMDWLMLYAGEAVGIALPFHFLAAALVAVWLICNEVISILENIGDIGVALPPFLLKAVQWVKAGAEKKGDPGDE